MNTILPVASLKLRHLNVEPYLNLEGQAPQFQVQSTFCRSEVSWGCQASSCHRGYSVICELLADRLMCWLAGWHGPRKAQKLIKAQKNTKNPREAQMGPEPTRSTCAQRHTYIHSTDTITYIHTHVNTCIGFNKKSMATPGITKNKVRIRQNSPQAVLHGGPRTTTRIADQEASIPTYRIV